VIGPGRAGLGVARAAADAGVDVVGVLGRRPHAAGPSLGQLRVATSPADARSLVARATVVFVAVQDRATNDALAALARAPLASGAVVLQASGSLEPAAFVELRMRQVPCGTFHPLVPLSAPERAPALLRGAWVGVDGDAAAVDAATALASALGARVLHIPPGGRARYHAAAVFASNFPVTLAALAERLFREAGVDAGAARGAGRHLLASAVANLAALGLHDDTARALTGPVARGDAETVGRHVAALAGDAEAAALYVALANATLGMLRAAGGAGPGGEALAAVADRLARPSDAGPAAP
jgi:predicted short-subunit dehydrogenase-like oxidoreductase (DUF2520 family)